MHARIRLLKRVQKLLARCCADPGWWGVEIAHGKASLVDRWGSRWDQVPLPESEAMKGRSRGRKLEDALRVIRDQQTHIRLLEEQLRPGLVRDLAAAPVQEQLGATS